MILRLSNWPKKGGLPNLYDLVRFNKPAIMKRFPSGGELQGAFQHDLTNNRYDAPGCIKAQIRRILGRDHPDNPAPYAVAEIELFDGGGLHPVKAMIATDSPYREIIPGEKSYCLVQFLHDDWFQPVLIRFLPTPDETSGYSTTYEYPISYDSHPGGTYDRIGYLGERNIVVKGTLDIRVEDSIENRKNPYDPEAIKKKLSVNSICFQDLDIALGKSRLPFMSFCSSLIDPISSNISKISSSQVLSMVMANRHGANIGLIASDVGSAVLDSSKFTQSNKIGTMVLESAEEAINVNRMTLQFQNQFKPKLAKAQVVEKISSEMTVILQKKLDGFSKGRLKKASQTGIISLAMAGILMLISPKKLVDGFMQILMGFL